MEKQEQVEWDDLNKLLQHHGFKPVPFADPVENKNHSDLVFLDKRSAAEIRATLRTMLTDSERQQTLIHELVKSNNQLKEEVQKHMSQSVLQSQRATKLEGLLDRVKTRIHDLEDRYLSRAVQQHTQLQQEKQEAQKLCEVLEQKLLKQTEEKAQLQRKLYFTVKEEEHRLTRQSQTFQNICKKVSRHSSAADQQLRLKELKFYKHKLRSLEGLNKPNNTRLPKEDKTPQFSETISEQAREANLCAHYYQLLTEISAVVTSPNAPLQLHTQKPSSVGVELAGFQSLIPTLDIWAQQLHLLKELQQDLNKLAIRLMPWQPSGCGHNSAETVKVEDMILLVDSMLENTSTNDEKMLRSPTRYTLGSMVSHFQKLFDVTSLSGVYPRMNEVYTKLGEMTNAMRNLHDVLDLDNCSSSGKNPSTAEVMNQVARLVSSTKYSAGFHYVLGDADIDSIIVRVKQHKEFFPAFHALITEILQTLGVSHLNDILPALKSLKQKAE